MVNLAMELVGPWVLLGFSVGMEAFDKLLLMFPGVRSSLMFSGFGLKCPTSGFQSFTVISRLLHLYSTIDKTSRLKIKRSFTVRDTQRDSQSHMEKRKGRREKEVTRMR